MSNQQQPPGQLGPPSWPGAPPPKKRGLSTGGIIAIVIGGLLALCCIAGIVFIASAGDDDSDTSGTSTDENAAAEQAAGIGTPVRDGKFEFRVSKVDCGKTTVGEGILTKQAQGQFCLVTMSVKNIGDQAQTLDASSQYAYDTSERKLSADGVASSYANKNNEVFINQINPGNQVDGVVVFDLPKEEKLTKLELHDSPFSGGVTVKVG